MTSEAALAARMARVSGSAIMELLKATAGGSYISFASGLPDPALFPTDALAEITDTILATDGRAALQYGAAEGYLPLRDYVAETLRGRGIAGATAENVLITNGSQQALDLVARLLLDRGDRVLIESPTYLAALQSFDSWEAAYLSARTDSGGIDVEHVESLLRNEAPRLLFTLPNFQNPGGFTQNRERRLRLANLAASFKVPMLEDDAYHDLRYEGDELPPVTALASYPMAIYTGTFSKTIAPGLRVGYVYARPEIITRLTQLKQINDLHSGSFSQRIVYRFAVSGQLEPHVEQLRTVYRSRRDALLTALDQQLAGRATWIRPTGGMFVLVRLISGMNAAELLPRAMEAGIVYVPAAGMFVDGGGESCLRLNFVSSTEDQIRAGVGILADLLD